MEITKIEDRTSKERAALQREQLALNQLTEELQAAARRMEQMQKQAEDAAELARHADEFEDDAKEAQRRLGIMERAVEHVRGYVEKQTKARDKAQAAFEKAEAIARQQQQEEIRRLRLGATRDLAQALKGLMDASEAAASLSREIREAGLGGVLLPPTMGEYLPKSWLSHGSEDVMFRLRAVLRDQVKWPKAEIDAVMPKG